MKRSQPFGSGTRIRLPSWFKIRLRTNATYARISGLLQSQNLHTVCRSAACPNQTECWNSGIATFLILGDVCSRTCGFCGVRKGVPAGADREEPVRVAKAAAGMGLRYAVVTSVTRDDLDDGGSGLFAETIHAIRSHATGCSVEVLIPDFRGSAAALRTVADAHPDVLNHNLETVPSLYARVRPQAVYSRSLELLERARSYGLTTKSGIMLGLGESRDEVNGAMRDLRSAGCAILTIGQYLRPGRNNLPVARYYHPDEFAEMKRSALEMGFVHVAAGPQVRSSYHAGELQAGSGVSR